MEKYRIDRQTEKIYEYDESQNAYMFHSNFISHGFKKNTHEKRIVATLLFEKNYN
jgi:hypothetical protein